jgi:hypothetical protein
MLAFLAVVYVCDVILFYEDLPLFIDFDMSLDGEMPSN